MPEPRRADRDRGSRPGRWLRPPPLADPDERRAAASVHFLCLAFLAGLAVWALLSLLLVPRPPVLFALVAPLPLAIGTAFALGRRGRLRAAVWLLVGALWVTSTLVTTASGSVVAPGFSVYLIATLTAGLLIGVRAAVGVGLLSTAASLALAALASRGALPELIHHTPWSAVATEVMLLVATAALVADALDRMRASRERVVASEARTRALVDQAADGIAILDAQGRIVEANARLLRMLGHERDDILGRGVEAFLAGEHLEDTRRILGSIGGNEVVIRERTLQRRDGSTLPAETSVTRLSDGRLQAIVRDLSARREAERMQGRLRAALEEAGEGIALFDAEDRLVYANRGFRELFDAETPVTSHPHATKFADDPARRAILDEARAENRAGRTWSRRFEQTGPDGARHVRFVVTAPVQDRPGVYGGFVAIVREVTREAELEDSLHRAQKLDAVGQLAGGLAHDFNNLLTVVLGAGEALHERRPDDAEVGEILEAARRAADLTAQLLTFSRRQPVRPQRVDLNERVRAASPVLRRLVRENVELVLALAPDPCWVEADPNQLDQILVNLAANARDAMERGGRFEIATCVRRLPAGGSAFHLRLPPGPYVVLRASDTGAGMDEPTLQHLFEPFFTTKEVGRGTGLGLASVHGIVQQAGGGIDVESRPGKGTRFSIYLPRVEPASDGARPAPRARGPHAARALVVEDDPAVLRIVVRTLEAAGHTVHAASRGRQALDLDLPAGSLDLLVTDVVMPERDGPAVADALRRRHPQLRVLFTSGHVPAERSGTVAASPRCDFLQKPFTPAELIERVDALLDTSEGPSGPALR